MTATASRRKDLSSFFSGLACRPKNARGISSRIESPPDRERGQKVDNESNSGEDEKDDDDEDGDEDDDDCDDDHENFSAGGAFHDEEELQWSVVRARTRMRTAKRRHMAGEPSLLRRTNGGRIVRAQRLPPVRAAARGKRQARLKAGELGGYEGPDGAGAGAGAGSGFGLGPGGSGGGIGGGKTRRLLRASQVFNRSARVPLSLAAADASDDGDIPVDAVWEAMLALPGFLFPESAPATPAADHACVVLLGRLLADPAVVRMCGRSLARRRLPNLVILLLTLPMRTHGRGSLRGELAKDGGFTPGDERNPAFWSRHAARFASLLPATPDSAVAGIASTSHVSARGRRGSGAGRTAMCLDLDGAALQILVTLFSTARKLYLDRAFGGGLGNGPGPGPGSAGGTATAAASAQPQRQSRPLSYSGTDDVEDGPEGSTAATAAMATAAAQTRGGKTRHPTQHQRRVSIAADAWALFVDKSRGQEFDPEMLADLYI